MNFEFNLFSALWLFTIELLDKIKCAGFEVFIFFCYSYKKNTNIFVCMTCT